MTNAIELNHISKSFGEFSLKDVTLAVPAGTICGLVGENGAGKSTLIRILMGALRPDSGTAAALGVDVSAPEFLNAKEDIRHNFWCWTRPPPDWTPLSETRSWSFSMSLPGTRPTPS